VTDFSKLKRAYTEFSSDNDFYIKRLNPIVLFHFENRQVFLSHPVYCLYSQITVYAARHEVHVFISMFISYTPSTG
jgi:hypothetical protein